MIERSILGTYIQSLRLFGEGDKTPVMREGLTCHRSDPMSSQTKYFDVFIDAQELQRRPSMRVATKKK